MLVKMWGTRGSVPTPGAETARYGGNTPCVGVTAGDGERIILDAGIGMHWLGQEMLTEGFAGEAALQQRSEAHILLTHTHWAHIQGIPFFSPNLFPGNQFYIYGATREEGGIEKLLFQQMDTAYCPVPNFFDDTTGALTSIEDIDDAPFTIGQTTITARAVNHIAGTICLGYRVANKNSSMAYIPDVEYVCESDRDASLELAKGVDLLIHDAHFTAAEAAESAGCGHCSDADAVDIARRAGVSRLLLFHHHPNRHDDDVETVAASHQGEDFQVEAATERVGYEL
ncbi:MAG: MBL fold metallo-hydrolase [Candidatus Latescibacterota bacterium]|nr:MBL fold metallo-hydrolase [Candidatus Latescibacterota bacterium]